jgi:hypothetical protein
MKRSSFLFVVIAFLTACKPPKEECAFQPKTSNVKIELNFTSLADSIVAINTKQQLVDFFARHTALRDVFFNRGGYPSDSVFINELYQRFTNPSFDTLLMDTKKVFGDGRSLKQEFTKALTNLRFYYPTFKLPRIETVITGLESDLFVSDTLIIVGLDHFLGKNSSYKLNMYEYMARRYTKEFVVPSAMLLLGIDSRLNMINPDDRTVLADMIAYGKAYYFAKHLLPCVPDSIFIGYTSKEMSGVRENQDVIWKHLIDQEVFFSTSKLMKQKYLDERPTTIEIGDQCPGRVGVWIGWQIVNKFAKQNPTASPLRELMKANNPERILKDSKFRAD